MRNENSKADGNRTLSMLMVLAMWLIVLGLLAMAFGQYLDHRDHPNRHAAGQVSDNGFREITLQANQAGHYMAEGRINGETVTFMLDTGASDVSIPQDLATRLGLEPGRPVSYQTANGVVTGFATQLGSISVGPIEKRDVRGSINPGMQGDRILLGMSFLRDLEFTQRDGRLTLRQPP
ncbi:aspartyl protease family protein [Natronocella acetinitrilica]|jgi:aspartyl protease family protein|uniref:Aspartyl protease family protein n=1 Tax=Natronocella acetinitrilica TaxID=414046 RepID=A0AAE3GAV3_9GAMM|nr:TIGR02281 family clan AA aspartic protease [Natronocella acetinitrilica]MCP1676887.1 aspartyl protease family protein [Natronocella acetinitrilica]